MVLQLHLPQRLLPFGRSQPRQRPLDFLRLFLHPTGSPCRRRCTPRPGRRLEFGAAAGAAAVGWAAVLPAALALAMLPLALGAHPEGGALRAMLLKLLAPEPEAAAGARAALVTKLLVHVGALQGYPLVTKATRTKELAFQLVFRNIGDMEAATTTSARTGMAAVLLVLHECFRGDQIFAERAPTQSRTILPMLGQIRCTELLPASIASLTLLAEAVVARQALQWHAVLTEHARSDVLAIKPVLGELRVVEAFATTLAGAMLLTTPLLVVLEVL